MAYPPPTLDDRLTSSPGEPASGGRSHTGDHNDERDAINDIVTELGTGPKGAAASLTARLSTLETAFDTAGVASVLAAPVGDESLVTFHRAIANRATTPVKMLWVGDSEISFGFLSRPISTSLAQLFNPQNRPLSIWTASGINYPGDPIWGALGGGTAQWTASGGTPILKNLHGLAGQALELGDGVGV